MENKMFPILILSLVIFLIPSSDSASCPPSTSALDISPCVCLDGQEVSYTALPSTLQCYGSKDFDLGAIFSKLASKIPKDERAFDILYINNSALVSVPTDFKGFTFEEVFLDGTKKLQFGALAYSGKTAKAIKRFHVWDVAPALYIPHENLNKGELPNVEMLDYSTTYCPAKELLGVFCKCESLASEYKRTGGRGPVELTCSKVENEEQLRDVFKVKKMLIFDY